MEPITLPKKILRIEDLIFILPDNFDGDLQSGLRLLADYLDMEFKKDKNSKKSKRSTSNVEKDNLTMLLENKDIVQVAMNYGIFEIDENGNYNLK